MNNDFTYNMTEINEEEIMAGWDEINEDPDYTPGLDDGEWMEEEEDADYDFYGEEEYP
jgi:hypothetical protein